MVSNLSSIGFVFADDETFRGAVERLAGEASERLGCPHGDYAIWRSRTGAELWFHLAAPDASSGEREILGLTPFFEGRSEIPLSLTRSIRRPEDNAFEGAWTAWVMSADDGDELFPIVFDAIDLAAQRDDRLPRPATARITGFARSLELFATEADFLAAHAGRPQLAAEAFMPLGLFAAAADESAPAGMMPASTAVITGRVRDHAAMRNEATGTTFHWLLVDCLGTQFDIVADAELVTAPPVVGATLEAACWLAGRILDDERPA